jgi:hypothetical protein
VRGRTDCEFTTTDDSTASSHSAGRYRHWVTHMNLNLSIGPLMSLVAGILILVMPRLLNYIVAIYLIIIGLLGLFGGGGIHLK